LCFSQAFPLIRDVFSNSSFVGTVFAPDNNAIDAALGTLGTSVSAVVADPAKFSYVAPVRGSSFRV
jgi:hypothetical protein